MCVVCVHELHLLFFHTVGDFCTQLFQLLLDFQQACHRVLDSLEFFLEIVVFVLLPLFGVGEFWVHVGRDFGANDRAQLSTFLLLRQLVSPHLFLLQRVLSRLYRLCAKDTLSLLRCVDVGVGGRVAFRWDNTYQIKIHTHI